MFTGLLLLFGRDSTGLVILISYMKFLPLHGNNHIAALPLAIHSKILLTIRSICRPLETFYS